MCVCAAVFNTGCSKTGLRRDTDGSQNVSSGSGQKCLEAPTPKLLNPGCLHPEIQSASSCCPMIRNGPSVLMKIAKIAAVPRFRRARGCLAIWAKGIWVRGLGFTL